VESHQSAIDDAGIVSKIRESIVMRTTDLDDKDWVAPKEGEKIQKCINEEEAESVALGYMKI
jgi:hypothetical protein